MVYRFGETTMKNRARSNAFKNSISEFLTGVAPGEKGSRTNSNMPSFWTGGICSRISGFVRIAINLFRHRAIWNSEKIFKPIVAEEITYLDGSEKRFIDIGRDSKGQKHISLAITTTDLGNSQTLVFTNEKETDQDTHFIESEFRKVLIRDEKVKAHVPMQASSAIPFFLSKVRYPCYAKKEHQTYLIDGGAVSNLSAQLLKHDYGSRKDSPVRIAISCNDFKYYRPEAFVYDKAPKYSINNIIDHATALTMVVIEDGMCDDVQILLETGGSKEHVFVIKAGEIINCPPGEEPFLDRTISNIDFLELGKRETQALFEFGAWVVTHNLIAKMNSIEFDRAKRNGVTLALSGGGALFPVLFGAVYAMWEVFDIKAMAGTSAGAMTASYMAEAITKEKIKNS